MKQKLIYHFKLQNMELQEIIKRNYEATVKRGQISNKTTKFDFLNKLHEEVDELELSFNESKIYQFDIKELADVVLVCTAMAKHYGYDLLKAIENKALYNENRID